MHRIVTSTLFIFTIFLAFGADPTATNYTWSECQGSSRPYPTPTKNIQHPDTLTPVMINHIGRHGSRFPSSSKKAELLKESLEQATKSGSITPRGKELLTIVNNVIKHTDNRWGALDSLGMAEQRGIASRMYARFPTLMRECNVNAISSYSPRCVMSMYEFTHQLTRLNNKLEIYTSSGRQNSPLMRFFDNNDDYKAFRSSEAPAEMLNNYKKERTPLTALKRVFGENYPLDENSYALALAEYSVLAGLNAMSLDCDITKFFTQEEYNALWGVTNLSQYIYHAASTLSSEPADIASPLLLDLITTTDAYISDSTSVAPVQLRFGHAETIIPLLSLMHINECYYLTNYFDTVALHWHNFHAAPMASNLQIILFRSNSGKYYIRTDLNEEPTTLIPNDENIYVPWKRAKEYLSRCIPIYY